MPSEKQKDSIVSVGTMTNSVVQQDSPGAVASIRVIAGGSEKALIGDILKHVAGLVDSLPLPPDDRTEMKEDIEAAESQLKATKPKAGIISTCLNSLLLKLTTAAGAPLGAAIAEKVQWAIEQLKSVLGSI